MYRNKPPQVVLVIGASSGLGRAVAEHLSAGGFTVYTAARSIKAGLPHAFAMDATDPQAVQKAVDAIVETEGRLDALVYAAATICLGACEETTANEVFRVMEPTFFGFINAVHAVMPVLRAQGGGRILAISSLNGRLPVPFTGAYVAAKHALEGYCQCLAQETRPFGVRVTLVEPGDCQGGKPQYRATAKAAVDPASPYHVAFEAATRQIASDEAHGLPQHAVARAVQRLLESPNPPLRRVVCSPMQRLASLASRILPSGMLGRIIASFYKPRKGGRI